MSTVFYAAVSADGYLSGPNGGMAWAEKYLATGEDYGFLDLLNNSSAVLMGRNTFEFELEAGVSGDRLMPTYVLTHIPELYQGTQSQNLFFVGGEISEVLTLIRANHPGQIFVMGGANVVQQMIDASVLDAMRIFRSPDVLGGGTLLFDDEEIFDSFNAESTREFESGLIETVYRAR